MAELKVHFDRMGTEFRGQMLAQAQSSFGSRSSDLKVSRDLFRAYNFLTAVRGLQEGRGYAVDADTKSKAHSGEITREALQQSVERLYQEIRRRDQASKVGAKPPEQAVGLRGWSKVRAAVHVMSATWRFDAGQ